MKLSHYYITVAISGVALVLGIAALALGQANAQLRDKVDANQRAVQDGLASQQMLSAVAEDIAQVAADKPTFQELLRKAGFELRTAPSNNPAPASAPAPGASSSGQ